jgi:hypothetical protein
MDVSDASNYIFNEKENKGSQVGHTKKNNIKKNKIRCLKDDKSIHVSSLTIK